MTKAGEAGTFFPLQSLVDDFLQSDKKGFLEKHPDAALVFDELTLGDDPGFQTLAKKPEGKGAPARDAREKLTTRADGRWVFPLKKRDDKFACMITMGRAANNVLRLNVPSVSKFHCYFTHVARDGVWYIADANSSNGTFIDGAELPPSHGKVPLKNGSSLRFGPDVTGRFYDANALWELLQSFARGDSSGEGAILREAPDPAGG